MELYKNIDDKVFIIKNAIPKDLLNYLIDFTETNIQNKNAILRYNKKQTEKQSFIYMGDISDEDCLEFKNEKLFTKGQSKYYEVHMHNEDREMIDVYYQNILKTIFISNPIRNFKQHIWHLFKYEPGNFMGMHADGGNERLCTTVLYLNTMEDGFEGGEVIFYENFENNVEKKEIYKYRPEAGDVVVFSSLEDEGMYHSVSPIKNWNRYAHRIYWQKENNVEYIIT